MSSVGFDGFSISVKPLSLDEEIRCVHSNESTGAIVVKMSKQTASLTGHFQESNDSMSRDKLCVGISCPYQFLIISTV